MLKKLDSNEIYDKYQCWNMKCENKDTPFALIKYYIQYEDLFKPVCETCGESYSRELVDNGNHRLLIKFSCKATECETHRRAYCYNIFLDEWEGTPPPFIDYNELSNPNSNKQDETSINSNRSIGLSKENLIELGLKEIPNHTFKMEEIPLLNMKYSDYNRFLKFHKEKFVILVDLPDFIRTLRKIIPFNFELVLERAHHLLIEYIKHSFQVQDDYIIHYFSKPDNDLELSNKIIINFCMKNRKNEFFHILKTPTEGASSDIDSYLIANGIEILERCKIKGFGIICSEKDYHPVMQIASYKKIQSIMVGLDTPKIYEKYKIPSMKFIRISKFFEIPS
ncbi:MAG: hypothetical protein ACFE8N_04760 [Promethearchaeota archaeon]